MDPKNVSSVILKNRPHQMKKQRREAGSNHDLTYLLEAEYGGSELNEDRHREELKNPTPMNGHLYPL
jgi:hypothetical protein